MSRCCHTVVAQKDVDEYFLGLLLVGVLLVGKSLLFSGGFVAPRIQTLRPSHQGADSGHLVTYLSGSSLRCDVMVLVEYRNVTFLSGACCDVMILVEYCKVSPSKLIHNATHKPWQMY